MDSKITIHNLSRTATPPIHARSCKSFFCKFRGLMLRKSLGEFEGLLLIGEKDSKNGATIHMMFMRFDICVVWINSSAQVVDKQIAKRWKPYYRPNNPAQFILETHVNRYMDFNVGDQLEIEPL